MTGTTGTAREGGLPWPLPASARRPADERFDAVDDRLAVFVPAVMSVGLLFSLVTVARDLLQRKGPRSSTRRTAVSAAIVARTTLGETTPEPDDLGILDRPAYLVTALATVGGAAYVAIGSIANFLNDGGYVRDIGWLLAVSLALSVALAFLAVAAFAVYWNWPDPPPWTLGALRTAPLTVAPGTSGTGPSWHLGTALSFSAVATGLIVLMVGTGRTVALGIDQPISAWLVEIRRLDGLDALDTFGATDISLVLVLIIGASTFRCRVMALLYPAAFLLSWGITALLRELVQRPRPSGPGELASFPSGHMVQAVLLAGLLPLAIRVLLADRRIERLTRWALVATTVLAGLHRIHQQYHWPLDVLGGAGIGLTVVLATHWVIEHRYWHLHCSHCPWSDHPDRAPWGRGVFALDDITARWLGRIGPVLALAAAGGFVVAAVVIGIPTDPEGYGFGPTVTETSQLVLAGMLALAGLVAFLRPGLGAFLMVLASVGIGLLASVEYSPAITVSLTAALLVPAVVTWLAWQPTETIGRIAVLAVVTGGALSGTAVGATNIYDFYFGPTHPGSAAPPLESVADWLWLGDVGTDRATVVAGGLEPDQRYHLAYWVGDGGRPVLVEAGTDAYGLARFELSGLQAATSYDYAVIHPGALVGPEVELPDRADASFATFAPGPHDQVVVLGACARVGSNGFVFDTMVADRPDLHLALGDLHYANLESTRPEDHIAYYGVTASQPGQAALLSSVPTAYVWDDHDFGPNDADSTSPSRDAVSQAYRAAIPAWDVDPDPAASIGQAFTVGRVRYLLTDTRSRRTADTMLGEEQLAWFLDELVASSASHGLVVWANPDPWISAGGAGADDWSAYPEERRHIADTIAEHGIGNLIMVSGDAHMVAIDDGTNSDYATGGGGGFPVLHGAALDRPGSFKGGPYSEGAHPGGGQYGRLRIHDDGGDTLTVELAGRTWDDRDLVTLTVEVDVPPGARDAQE